MPTRQRLTLFVLLATSIAVFVLCLILLWPFVGSLTWALVLAIFGKPLHDWLSSRMRVSPSIVAGISVVVIAVIVVAPLILIGNTLMTELASVLDRVQKIQWKDLPGVGRLPIHIDFEQEATRAIDMAKGRAAELVQGTFWTVAEILITLLSLFYFFRDRQAALDTFRALSPLTIDETERIFGRVRVMVYATVYGTLTVAAIQGALGGLMFWFLGLPAPFFWGLVMAILSVFPMLGAFLIWGPTAVYLAGQGQWWQAAVLAGWGLTAVSLIDNLLYPILVGKEMRLHPLAVFFALLGGVFMFGAPGLVLGPLLLTIGLALLEVWRLRMLHEPDPAAIPQADPLPTPDPAAVP